MKVELTIARTDANAGDVVDVSKDEAKRLFEEGSAIPVRRKKTETATKVEKAVEKAARIIKKITK